ncbi:MAG: hypothetical protein H7831_04830 [Magnetococcus sp. WYHC-3]
MGRWNVVALVGLVLLGGMDAAHAGTVRLLDRNIEVVLPDGYCEMRERFVDPQGIARSRSATGNTTVELTRFAHCQEMREVESGRRKELDRFGTLAVQARSGQPVLVPGMPRSGFLEKLSADRSSYNAWLADSERSLQRVAPGFRIERNLGYFRTDAYGTYSGFVAKIPGAEKRQDMTAILTGTTLVREFIAVVTLGRAYRSENSLQRHMQELQTAVLQLVRANDPAP